MAKNKLPSNQLQTLPPFLATQTTWLSHNSHTPSNSSKHSNKTAFEFPVKTITKQNTYLDRACAPHQFRRSRLECFASTLRQLKIHMPATMLPFTSGLDFDRPDLQSGLVYSSAIGLAYNSAGAEGVSQVKSDQKCTEIVPGQAVYYIQEELPNVYTKRAPRLSHKHTNIDPRSS